MHESKRGPNPPIRWHERLIFWGVLFPADVLVLVWFGFVCWVGWPWR